MQFSSLILSMKNSKLMYFGDTGLEIKALNHAIVKSARYSGLDRDSNKNINKVLTNLRMKIIEKQDLKLSYL